jgi:hypothetical protein
MDTPTSGELLAGIVSHVILLFTVWLGPMAVALAYLQRRELPGELRALWTLVIAIPVMGPVVFFLSQWKSGPTQPPK